MAYMVVTPISREASSTTGKVPTLFSAIRSAASLTVIAGWPTITVCFIQQSMQGPFPMLHYPLIGTKPYAVPARSRQGGSPALCSTMIVVAPIFQTTEE